MSEFPTVRVDRSRSQSVEPLGSKPKFWFSDGGRRLPFKAEDRGTGQDWAEVVACHLRGLIELPHVVYELAVECDGDKAIHPGVVCENMAANPPTPILGNPLLLVLDPQDPHRPRFRVRHHTVEAVSDMVGVVEIPAGMTAEETCPRLYEQFRTRPTPLGLEVSE